MMEERFAVCELDENSNIHIIAIHTVRDNAVDYTHTHEDTFLMTWLVPSVNSQNV